MANEEHLARLQQGVEAWNQWRAANPGIRPDLSEAHLARENLRGANLSRADLDEAELTHADLSQAELRGANLWAARLIGAHLHGADLIGASLIDANLHQANLFKANLHRAKLHQANLLGVSLFGVSLIGADLLGANLSGANLSGADLTAVRLVETDLNGANLAGCRVYGISAWDVHLTGAQQSDLIITPADEPVITVDNLDVAQFIYLLLHNEKIREVIDTITSKAVLILGRFNPPERKAVLDAIRDEVRFYDYLPIMFDFQKPEGRNYIETVSTLAHMARFVIADITDAKVVLQELERIVPSLPSVPVQPVVRSNTDINAVIIDSVGRLNFLEQLYVYQDIADVKANLHSKIIQPAEAQLTEIQAKRLQFLEQVRQITHR
jgi:uncharacterized protein YjbI with pentapeptide repeats